MRHIQDRQARYSLYTMLVVIYYLFIYLFNNPHKHSRITAQTIVREQLDKARQELVTYDRPPTDAETI